MIRQLNRLPLLIAFSFVLLGGCSITTPLMKPKQMDPDKALESWSRVLERHVREDGRVDFEGLQTDMNDLTTCVRFLGNAHLVDFPDEQAKLAALINGYNALALYNVIMAEKPEDLEGWFGRTQFFKWRKYLVMGEYKSLTELRSMILKQANDDRRLLFALVTPDAGAPRLRREPFQGAQLETQLDEQARRFVNEPRNVWLDDVKKDAHVSEVLNETGDPMAFINRYRDNQVSPSYSVKVIPRDWEIYKAN